MSTDGDAGGITGGGPAAAGQHPRRPRRTIRGRIVDGINTGWAGGGGGRREHGRTSPARRKWWSAPPAAWAKRRRAASSLNVIPRDGGNTFSGTFFVTGANGAMQGSNYTQALQDAGLRAPQELIKHVRHQSDGRRPHHPGQAVVLPPTARSRRDNTVPGMWFNKNAGNPNAWTVDFDRSRPAFNDNLDRNAIARLTWQITPRNKFYLTGPSSVSATARQGRRRSRRRRRKRTAGHCSSRRAFQQATWSSPVTSRLLLEAGWGTYQARYREPRAAPRRQPQPRMIRAQEQARRDPGPDLPDAGRRRRRLQSPSDRDAGDNARLALVCHRRAQHEVRLPGRVQQSVARPTRTSTRSSTSGCATA